MTPKNFNFQKKITAKITLISMIKKMPLTLLDVKKLLPILCLKLFPVISAGPQKYKLKIGHN